MNIENYIALLQSADEKINRANALLLIEATEDLRAYAQSIAHRKSGVMGDTLARYGPFSVAAGTLESHVESGADYAELEVARGGAHDWATRTIAENDARILQLQLEVENALVKALTGGP